MKLVQDGIAKAVDLVQAQALIRRQKAADLAEGRVSFPRPALRRVLGGQELCQGEVSEEAGTGGQDQKAAEDPKDKSLAFGEFSHDTQLSARRTMSPFFTGAELVVMT